MSFDFNTIPDIISGEPQITGLPGLQDISSFLNGVLDDNSISYPANVVKGDGQAIIECNVAGVGNFSGSKIWMWLFPDADDDSILTAVIVAGNERALSFSEGAYRLTGVPDSVMSSDFWEGAYLLYSYTDVYRSFSDFVKVVVADGNEKPEDPFYGNEILLTTGLNILGTWNLENAFDRFNLRSFSVFATQTPLPLLVNELPGGMMFSMRMQTDKPASLLKVEDMEVLSLNAACFTVTYPFADVSGSSASASVSAEVILFDDTEATATIEAFFPVDSSALRLAIYPAKALNKGLEKFTELLGFGNIESLPSIPLSIELIELTIGEDGISSAQLQMAAQDAESGWEIITGFFTVYDVGITLYWQKGTAISFTARGEVNVLTFNMDVSYSFPAHTLSLSMQPEAETEGKLRNILGETGLNMPEALTDAVVKGLTAFDLALDFDISNEELQIVIRNDKSWTIGNFIEVTDAQLQLDFLNEWKFTGADLYVALAMPIGPKVAGGDRENVMVDINASYDMQGGIFTFEGSTGDGQSIAVGDAIASIGDKIGGHVTLPDAIKTLTVSDIEISFDSNGNANFACRTWIAIEGTELQLDVHFQRIVGERTQYKISGELHLNNGLTLGVAFSNEGGSTVVGVLQYPFVLSSRELLALISPELAANIPFNIDIAFKEMLLCWHKPPDTSSDKVSRFLFRIMLDLDLDLTKLPLVGPMMPKGIGFRDLQVIASTPAQSVADISSYNTLLGEFSPRPETITGIAGTATTATAIERGITISGNFQLDEQNRFPLSQYFGGSTATKQQQPALSQDAGAAPTQPPDVSGSSQQSVDKKAGPVEIHKVGLVFDEGSIGIKISAGLNIGPMELSLIGMQVTVPIEVLHDPSLFAQIAFGLDGLGMDLEEGPMSLSLAFMRKSYTDSSGLTYDEYAGLVKLAFKNIQLSGVGAFAMYQGNPAMYLFAALGMPLGGPPAFFVTGLLAGFGVNRDFIPPKVSKVTEFPLITLAVPFAKVGETKAELDILMDKLHTYLPPRLGQYWFAAGICFRSFGIIETTGLVAVKFGNDLELDILGVSTITLPGALIELQFLMRFVPAEGYIMLRGELTARSYLFAPVAHLTGGFAVGFWFEGEHEGDFVISVGGYHPRFNVPKHFPNDIPRLALNWQLSDEMSFKGALYFAVTPQAIMAGGFLEAVFDIGFLYAHLKISVDFIIYYAPFRYDAQIVIEIYVRVTIDFCLFSIHIDVNLMAGVHIWGPEFAGIAYLDIGVKVFEVEFGAIGSSGPQPLSWSEFKEGFLPKAGPGTISIGKGLIRKVSVKLSLSKDTIDINIVSAKNFLLLTDSVLPLTEISTGRIENSDVKQDHIVNSDYLQPGIVPMNVAGYNAVSTITISKGHIKEGVFQVENICSEFSTTPVLKNVPKALWGNKPPDKEIEKQAEGVLKDALCGLAFVPGNEIETGATLEVDRGLLSFRINNSFTGFIFPRAAIQFAKRSAPSMGVAKELAIIVGLDGVDADISELQGEDGKFGYNFDIRNISFSNLR